MITKQSELKELISKARATDAVAIDTEFIWERTYYPRLGLIQLALSDEDCYLIDPCTLGDLTILADLLTDRKVVKIFHDAPQDLAILSHATQCVPKNIFDTRLAAGFAGLPATLSLSNLIKKLLDIELPKTETRTDWLQRPLDEKQVAYALDDVRYLRAARILLLNSIIGPEIKSWLEEELELLDEPATYMGPEDNKRYQKLRGAGSLKDQSLAILRELVIWREQEAKNLNRPRGHIVTDKILLCISKNQLKDVEAIQATCSTSLRVAKRYGDVLSKCVTKGLKRRLDSNRPLSRPIKLNKKDKQSHERLNTLIQLKSEVQGLDPTLIGNSAELKMLVKILNNSCESRLLRQMEGWRKVFLKDFFRQPA